MTVDIKLIRELRQKTGVGMSACRQALEEAKGDMGEAVEILRKKGQKIALAKQTRLATQGQIGAYLHSNGKIAALVEVVCETDFVARNEEFGQLVHDLAMQVAATNPVYLSPKNVPEQVLKKEKDIYRAALKGEKKPKALQEKIIEGKLAKFFAEVCLLKQSFIKDDKISVEEYLTQKIAKLGENIQIKRFVRFAL